MLRSLNRYYIWLIVLVISSFSLTAQTVFFDDCACSTDGESFEQRFSLVGESFQTWEVVSASNYFESIDPYTEFASSTNLTLAGMTNNVYEISGFRIGGVESSITVTNGSDVLTYRFPETCDYPEIDGDEFVCEGSGPATYSVSDLTNIVWSASGVTLIGDINSESVSIDWSNEATGFYNLSVSGEYALGGNACPVTLSLPVQLSENNIADQLACNNLVNISLDGSCNLQVVADMILEATDVVNDAYDVVLKLEEDGEPLDNEMVTMDYLGVPLIVEVSQQCGGNSCWGIVIVEDKSAPAIFCPEDVTLSCEEMLDPAISGIPVPMDVVPILIDENTYLLEDFDFCGDAILTYYDELVDNSLCEGPFASIVERIWVLTDVNDNVSMCSHFISVERADLLDVIEWPEDYDAVLPGANPPLASCGNWPALENGHPSPDFTGYPIGTFCSNVHVTFEDVPLEKCGHSSVKIIRRWEIRDICGDSDDVIVHNQYIMTVDEEAPDLKEYTEQMIVEAEGHFCISDIVVPAPELNSPECSYWDYYVGYKFDNDLNDPYAGLSTEGIVFDNNLGLYVIQNIPAQNQKVWIMYIAEDECGNISSTSIEVTAIDIEMPVPVCDLNTTIGLNEYGISHAGVYTFDDGSWDNCSLSHLEVRRMDGAPCDEGTIEFSDKVHFCCDDVGKEIQVQLRAYDFANNFNDCMVNVIVQDNVAPKLVSCPPDLEIDCDADIDNLPLYGSAVFTDECSVEVTHADKILNIGDCGTGTRIERTFTATDKAGNTATCTQTINLRNFNIFNGNSINWPDDVEMFEGCLGSDIDPANLPNGFSEPVYNAGPCDMVAHNFSDVVFEDSEEACLKVLRKWRVINECTDEQWEQTQVIKLTNSQGPVVSCNDSEIEDDDPFNCGAVVTVSAEATDDCTNAQDLEWSYIVNGNPAWSGNTDQFERHFDQGVYQVVWTVTDACGNSTQCTTDFEVEDIKAPSPICLEFVITTLRENQQTSELWASDFIKDAYDDCSDENDIRFSFSPNVNDQTRFYTCDDLENGILDTLEVLIWVTDESGNQDFCTTMLILQDNADFCPDLIVVDEEEDDEEEEDGGDDDDNTDDEEEEIARINLAGHIYLPNQNVMPDVMVHLESTELIYDTEIATDDEGAYAFSELDMYLDYKLTPSYDGDYLDGVSTLDLVIMQKHILGIEMLGTPYQIIAADANNSQTVSALDLIELRKLILGIYEELPNNTSWRFVDKSMPIPDANSPFPLQESMTLNNVEVDYMESDFIAIKVGDVNNTLQNLANNEVAVRSGISKYFSVDDITFQTGEAYTIDIKAETSESIEGFQSAFQFTGLELIDVIPGKLSITAENVHQHYSGLKISWNDKSQAIESGDVLFSLKVGVNELSSSAMAFKTLQNFESELYTSSDFGLINHVLGFRLHSDDQAIFALHQNLPNPFDTETTVSFTLPKAQDAEIIISDYTGRMIYHYQDYFNAGLNQIQIQSDELNTSGILYLQLKTNSHSGTQKMLLIK